MTLQMAQTRALMIRTIRAFFDRQKYLEVDTPALSPYRLPEAHIEPFVTSFDPPDTPSRELYLLPSPERWIKELIADGFGSVYQIGKCYRNAEQLGPHHRPEFTMLEWYTVGADYLDSAETTDALLGDLVQALAGPGGTLAASPQTVAGDTNAKMRRALETCTPPAIRVSVAALCAKHAGVPQEAFSSAKLLRETARRLEMHVEDHEDPADTFHRIFMSHVEPRIPRDRPVIITDYPEYVPAFAEATADRPFRRRWELYLGGIEVANCYTELRDRQELESLLSEQRRRESAAAGGADPAGAAAGDAAFAADFSQAPACSGVALGVDRLLMALSGVSSIEGVLYFGRFWYR